MHKHGKRRELRDAPVARFYPGMSSREINRFIRKAQGRVRIRVVRAQWLAAPDEEWPF